MKNIIITGGTGMLGQHLTTWLLEKGYSVSILSRKKNNHSNNPRLRFFYWNPSTNEIDTHAFKNIYYLIHLAGENIGTQRWTKKRKKELLESRVNATRFLCNILQSQPNPQVIISTSAIGIYGLNPTNKCTETSPTGTDFLATLTRHWEDEIHHFSSFTKRIAIIRTGIVWGKEGGMLHQFLQLFSLHLAILPGNKNPYLSWIHIDDWCRLAIHLLENESLSGIYNAVAPHPIQLTHFIEESTQLMKKKILRIACPLTLLRLLLGERACLLTASAHVSSKKIEKTGFSFQWPTAAYALRNLLHTPTNC